MVGANCDTEPVRFPQTSGFFLYDMEEFIIYISLLDLDLYLE